MAVRSRRRPVNGLDVASAGLIVVAVALFTYDVIQPSVIVIAYFMVPVLLSVALLRPWFTGSLAGLVALFGLITAQVNDYWANINTALNMILLFLLSAAAFGFSLVLTQGARQRDSALARLSGAMESELDAHVIASAVRDRSGQVVDFIYRDVNPVACEVLGHPKQDLIGHKMHDVFPTINEELFQAFVTVADSGQAMLIDEFKFVSVIAGAERVFDFRIVPADGEISVGWRDVTDALEDRRRLEEAERRARLLLDNSTDVVWEGTNEGVATWISPSVQDLVGWRPDEIVGRQFLDFVHPDDQDRLRAAGREVGGGSKASLEVRVRNREGGYRWIAIRAAPMLDEQGQVIGRSGGWRDIQEEVEARAKLEAAEARFRLLTMGTSDVILQVGPEGAIQWVSPSLTRALGWAVDDLVNRPLRDFMHQEETDLFNRLFTAIGLSEPKHTLLRFRQPGGVYRWVDVACDALTEPGEGWVLRLRDAEPQIKEQRELAEQAATDPVTGLANRLAAIQQLRETVTERRDGQDNAVLFVDLDRFKQINDTLGHQAGDEVLRTVGERIKGTTRSTDFVARFGGDELLVILHGVGNPAQAEALAENIRKSCAEPIDIGRGETASTTVSIGIAVTRRDEDMDHLLLRADSALYRAKEAGRDRVVTDAG